MNTVFQERGTVSPIKQIRFPDFDIAFPEKQHCFPDFGIIFPEK
jgi:hypothetical protein